MSQSPNAPDAQGIVGKAGWPSAAFLAAWALVLGNEGGFVDNPADPGGATCWGVTERVARAAGYTGAMRDLPRLTAEQIGYERYWHPYRLDELDPRVATQVFDGIYSSGPGAVRWLQQACGAKADGDLGPKTIAAAAAVPAPKLIARFDARRLLFLADLPTWPSFGRGWARRIGDNLLKGET